MSATLSALRACRHSLGRRQTGGQCSGGGSGGGSSGERGESPPTRCAPGGRRAGTSSSRLKASAASSGGAAACTRDGSVAASLRQNWCSSSTARLQQQHGRRHRLAPVVAAATAGDAAAAGASPDGEGGDDDGDEEGEELLTCSPAFVSYSNESPHYTRFTIDVADYPGLLRVVAWCLNGLSCRVHNAVLRTTRDDAGGDEAIDGGGGAAASDVLWVTDLRGRKLPDNKAADVAARLEEYVSFCAPPQQEAEFEEYDGGDIVVSNLKHAELTEVTVTAALFSPGLVLELASLFTGQGFEIRAGLIRGGSDNPIPPELLGDLPGAEVPQPAPGQRVMRFWLGLPARRGGGKLAAADVSALLYSLRLVLGEGSVSTRPPGTELLLGGMGGGGFGSLSDEERFVGGGNPTPAAARRDGA